MTTPQVDGRTFLENLPNITYQSGQPTAAMYPNGVGTSPAVTPTLFLHANDFITTNNGASDLFSAYLNTLGSSYPTNIQSLLSGFNTYAASHGGNNTYSVSQLLTGFTSDYRTAIGYDQWQITPQPSVGAISTQFQAWMSGFLSTYTPVPGSPTARTDLLVAMGKALAVTAALSSKTTMPTIVSEGTLAATVPIIGSGNMPRYEDIYKVYNPTATTAQAQAAIDTFYAQQITARGFFIPSQSLEQFTQFVVQTAPAAGPTVIPDLTSLASMGANKTLILNDIYALIASMLNSLQRIAAVQSNRLNLLTQWQSAYSQQIGTLHSFLSTDNSPLNDPTFSDSNKTNVRGVLNDTTNSNYRTLLQNNQSVIGDDSKSLQGNINQVQDEISQQNNRATAIIQELGTLLNAIFK